MPTGWGEFLFLCRSLASVPCAQVCPAASKQEGSLLALVARRPATLTTAQGSEGNAGWMFWDPARSQRGVAQADPMCLVLDTLEKSLQQGGLPPPMLALLFWE